MLPSCSADIARPFLVFALPCLVKENQRLVLLGYVTASGFLLRRFVWSVWINVG
jgi:hypothetical protein